jgi:hypothetical protein
VSPQFGDNNSYAAPDTWLWRVPASPTLPTQFDEVFAQRSATCASMGSAAPPHCIVASMGHPNVLGAQAYAMAIIAALPNLVAQSWQPEFATRKQAQ